MFFQRIKTKGLGRNAYIIGCGERLAVVVHLADRAWPVSNTVGDAP